MKQQITTTIIIAVAIVIAAVAHALIIRDTGRYRMINDYDILDTRTGERFEKMENDFKSHKLDVR